jgi:hypothetical protein
VRKKEGTVPAKNTFDRKRGNKKKTVRRQAKRTARVAGEGFSSIMSALRDETQPIVANKPANTYVATVSFGTDRRLTADEVARLVSAVAVQIEDPSGADGEKRADFATSDVEARIKRTRKIVRRRK